MKTDDKLPDEATEAARHYARAYAAHYGERDLQGAVRAYAEVIASHAGTPEEGYACAQIGNIVHGLVPPQALLAAHVELALRHGRPPAGGPRAPTAP
jgi:hypothetical protein